MQVSAQIAFDIYIVTFFLVLVLVRYCYFSHSNTNHGRMSDKGMLKIITTRGRDVSMYKIPNNEPHQTKGTQFSIISSSSILFDIGHDGLKQLLFVRTVVYVTR